VCSRAVIGSSEPDLPRPVIRAPFVAAAGLFPLSTGEGRRLVDMLSAPCRTAPGVAPPAAGEIRGSGHHPSGEETLFQLRRTRASAAFKTVWGRPGRDLKRSAELEATYASGTDDVKI